MFVGKPEENQLRYKKCENQMYLSKSETNSFGYAIIMNLWKSNMVENV